MVGEGVLGFAVLPVTDAVGGIPLHDALPLPVAVTLDAKVVMPVACQVALTGTAFQQPLCQGDAGGHAILLRLLDGNVLILVDIGEKLCR